MKLTCPKCSVQFEAQEGQKTFVCPQCSFTFSSTDTETKTVVSFTKEKTEGQVIPPGTKLGQYEIIELIGKGGMGVVYKARQLTLDRIVALKILSPSLSKNSEFLERFHREAKVLAELNHPNIVSIYDKGIENDMVFFVMEYVDGVSLRKLISDKVLSPEEALKLVPQMCDALDYAHSQGIVHRDIKPENILIDKKGRVKITDFGIARIIQGTQAASSLTQTDITMGTYDYMAPEQRLNPKIVDQRADIYSMGVIIYEMLTGELPVGKFKLPSEKIKIDIEIDKVILKALAKEPELRYQKVSELSTDIINATTKAKKEEQPTKEEREVESLSKSISDSIKAYIKNAIAGSKVNFLLLLALTVIPTFLLLGFVIWLAFSHFETFVGIVLFLVVLYFLLKIKISSKIASNLCLALATILMILFSVFFLSNYNSPAARTWMISFLPGVVILLAIYIALKTKEGELKTPEGEIRRQYSAAAISAMKFSEIALLLSLVLYALSRGLVGTLFTTRNIEVIFGYFIISCVMLIIAFVFSLLSLTRVVKFLSEIHTETKKDTSICGANQVIWSTYFNLAVLALLFLFIYDLYPVVSMFGSFPLQSLFIPYNIFLYHSTFRTLELASPIIFILTTIEILYKWVMGNEIIYSKRNKRLFWFTIICVFWAACFLILKITPTLLLLPCLLYYVIIVRIPASLEKVSNK